VTQPSLSYRPGLAPAMVAVPPPEVRGSGDEVLGVEE
jgi:hypothetical protein